MDISDGNLSLDRDQQAVVPLGTDISVTCILWASDKMTQDITIEWYTPDMEIIEDDLAERSVYVIYLFIYFPSRQPKFVECFKS